MTVSPAARQAGELRRVPAGGGRHPGEQLDVRPSIKHVLSVHVPVNV